MTILYPDYVKTPTKCLISKLNSEIASRKRLTACLKNNYNKSLLFILMNPSQANEYNSDRTINKCASIAYHDLAHLHVGKFSIVNVYPFYQSQSSQLQNTIIKTKKVSSAFYYKELFENLRVIRQGIQSADYIVMGTGGIPDTIQNKKEYQFILHTILDALEVCNQTVYLPTSKRRYNGYLYQGIYPYHICPRGNPNTIDALKPHKVVNGTFIEIPNDQEVLLT